MFIAVLIDGQYLYEVQQMLGYEHIDLRVFVDTLVGSHPHKAWYFTNDMPSEAAAERHERFLNAIREKGLKVVKGSVIRIDRKCPHCGQVLTDYQQKEVDVAMAIAAIRACKFANKIILVTGDGDFAPLLRALEHRVLTVLVAHQPSSYLRQHADQFIELGTVLAKTKEKMEKRAQRRKFVCPECGGEEFSPEKNDLVRCKKCGAVLKPTQ